MEKDNFMTSGTTAISYVKSLAWIMLFSALFGALVTLFMELMVVCTDSVHGVIYKFEQLLNLSIFIPILGFVTSLASLTFLFVPQIFQAGVASCLVGRLGRWAGVAVLAALPITALLTWYSFDWMTPTDMNLGAYDGPTWKPWAHGLTPRHYLVALGCQGWVTMFCVAYGIVPVRLRGSVVLLGFAATLVFATAAFSTLAAIRIQAMS